MPNILIHTCLIDKVWTEASERVVEVVSASVTKREKTLLFLSGGSVVKMYSALGSALRSTDLLLILQVDERFKPERKEETNAFQIARTGLWQACKKKSIPFYIVSQKGTLAQSTAKYNHTISKIFKSPKYTPEVAGKLGTGFKLAILGIGPDCHTAGLAPGYQDKWNVKRYVVGYRNRGLYPQRITLTPFAIERLDYAIVVAVGGEKTQAIKNALDPANLSQLNKDPAAIIQKINQVELFTDQKV